MSDPLLTRRMFLLGLSGALLTGLSRTWAYPVETLLGSGQKGYIQHYIQRMLKWYGHAFFDFNRVLSREEQAYIASCIESLKQWGYPLGREQSYDYFLLGHEVKDQHINHSLLSIGCADLPPHTKALAHSILKKRGLTLPSGMDHFFGLGWNCEKDIFETYSFHRTPIDAIDAELSALVSPAEEKDLWPQRISRHSFKGNKLIHSALTVAYRQPPHIAIQSVPFGSAAVAVMQFRSPFTGNRWHFRLNAFDLSMISPLGQGVANEHDHEFAQMTDSLVWNNPNDYTLYYP